MPQAQDEEREARRRRRRVDRERSPRGERRRRRSTKVPRSPPGGPHDAVSSDASDKKVRAEPRAIAGRDEAMTVPPWPFPKLPVDGGEGNMEGISSKGATPTISQPASSPNTGPPSPSVQLAQTLPAPEGPIDLGNHHEELHEILSKDASSTIRQSPSPLNTAMPQPTPPVETPNFKSAVDDVYARMSVSMQKLLADHAATKKLYAERVQRESEVCNLTVEDAFCDIDDGSSRSWKARKAALLASQSVVGLSSFSGERRIRVCSGFVIRWNSYASTCKILTSATLVGSPSRHNHVIPDVRVKVCLPSGTISDGLITMIDFHYNIAVVEVKSDQKLPKAFLLRDVSCRGAVLAIGRFYDDGRLMCSRGRISKQASTFECSELLVSSCNITMAGVGGPLVNYSGDVLGINFCGDNHTPYLSMAVVSRCLEHHRNYGKIIRPWLGFWCTSLELLPLRVLEHVYKKFQYSDKGLYISKVDKGSPADVAGLCVGDVLIKCAGKVPSTAPEFGALLLDISKEHMEMGNREINGDSLRGKITVEVTVRKRQDGRTVRKTLAADVLKEFDYYRWPAAVPTYNNCKVMARKQFMQWL